MRAVFLVMPDVEGGVSTATGTSFGNTVES